MRFDYEDQIAEGKEAAAGNGVAAYTYTDVKEKPAAQDMTQGENYAIVVFPQALETGATTVTFEALESTAQTLQTSPESISGVVTVLAANFKKGSPIIVPFIKGSMGKAASTGKTYYGLKVGVIGTVAAEKATFDAYVMPEAVALNKFKSFPKVGGAEINY